MTFELFDLVRLGILTFLEILLSADNAAVLAILAKDLPQKLRERALYIGVVSAFVLRGIMLLGVSYLLENRWIQIAGAIYLLFLSIRHFFPKKQSLPHTPHSFWKTVFLIELFDLAFAIDSIVAGIAFIASIPHPAGQTNPKLWIVYVGGILGLLTIRYAASILSQLIDRFPRLETGAHIAIGWIGIKLAFPSLAPVCWVGLILAFIYGFFRKSKS